MKTQPKQLLVSRKHTPCFTRGKSKKKKKKKTGLICRVHIKWQTGYAELTTSQQKIIEELKQVRRPRHQERHMKL